MADEHSGTQEKENKAHVTSLDELLPGLIINVKGFTIEHAVACWVNAYKSALPEAYLQQTLNIDHSLAPTHEWLSRKKKQPRPVIILLADTDIGPLNEDLTESFTCYITTTLHGDPEGTITNIAADNDLPRALVASLFARLRGFGVVGDAGFSVNIRQAPPPSDDAPPMSTFRPRDGRIDSFVFLLPIRLSLLSSRITYQRPPDRSADNAATDPRLKDALKHDAKTGMFFATASSMTACLSTSITLMKGFKESVELGWKAMPETKDALDKGSSKGVEHHLHDQQKGNGGSSSSRRNLFENEYENNSSEQKNLHTNKEHASGTKRRLSPEEDEFGYFVDSEESLLQQRDDLVDQLNLDKGGGILILEEEKDNAHGLKNDAAAETESVGKGGALLQDSGQVAERLTKKRRIESESLSGHTRLGKDVTISKPLPINAPNPPSPAQFDTPKSTESGEDMSQQASEPVSGVYPHLAHPKTASEFHSDSESEAEGPLTLGQKLRSVSEKAIYVRCSDGFEFSADI